MSLVVQDIITIAICYSIFWSVIIALILYPKIELNKIKKRIKNLERIENEWKGLKKSKIVALVGIATTIIVIIVIMVFNVRPYMRVSQVMASPSLYYNKEIQVIGIVEGFSMDDFNITEGSLKILVDTSGVSIPAELTNGIEVVVTGIFNSSLILKATLIVTQCSWDY